MKTATDDLEVRGDLLRCLCVVNSQPIHRESLELMLQGDDFGDAGGEEIVQYTMLQSKGYALKLG